MGAWLAVKAFFAGLNILKIGIYLIVIAGAYGIGWFYGQAHEIRRNAIAVQVEVSRQIGVNQDILAKANKKADVIKEKSDKLTGQLERRGNEAKSDPDAAKCGIGPSGVRRLNSLGTSGSLSRTK